jgi:hypothetical protein
MPGRWFIGLSPDEKYPGQFRPAPLPDEPSLSPSRVVVCVVLALMVRTFGFYRHSAHVHSAHRPRAECLQHGDRNVCPPLPSSGVPIGVWLSIAVLVAAIVIAWPCLTFGAKLWIHRRHARRHPATPDAQDACA